MTTLRISLADLTPIVASAGTLTPNGYLAVPARVARDGVQEYYAYEFGEAFKDREWDSIIKVWRPAEEVFAPDSLASYSRIPVTDNHPWEDVSAANWKEHAVGMTEGEARQDGNFVAHQLLITDAAAVNDIQRGRRELSTGYSFIAELAPGITPEGAAYDIKATDIRANHIAIVDNARCGPECRAGDAAKSPRLAARLKDSGMCKCSGDKPKDTPMTNRTVAVDGLPVETTEAGAIAIEKLNRERDEARTALAAADAKVAAATAAHAAEIAAKDALIEEAKKAVPDAAKLEQMARDHATVATLAKALHPALEVAGKDTAALRKEAVAAKLGDTAKDYTPDQIKIAFDILAKDAKPEASTDTFVPAGTVQVADTKPAERSERKKQLEDGWKRPAA